jgi:NADPH:quinone reductase-like Zn-dependent oxidoreductase
VACIPAHHAYDRLLRPVIDLAIEGAITPIIDSRLPFDHARDVHDRLHQRRDIGKR